MDKYVRSLQPFFGSLAAILIFTGLSGAVSQTVINDDHGGSIELFLLQVNQAKAAGTKIIFAGRCDSACALFLSLTSDQLCVTKNARFGFHKAYMPFFRGSAWSIKVANAYTKKTFAMYPLWVQSWIKKEGGMTDEVKTMRYDYVRRYLATCKQ